MTHPFIETAQLLEEMLREQRQHDKRGDGVVIFATEDAEDRARYEARRLRELARSDIAQGGWPQ